MVNYYSLFNNTNDMKKLFLLLSSVLLMGLAAWAATEYGVYVAGTRAISSN